MRGHRRRVILCSFVLASLVLATYPQSVRVPHLSSIGVKPQFSSLGGAESSPISIPPARDFEMSVFPSTFTLTQGSSNFTTITLTSLNGFAGILGFGWNLSCLDFPQCPNTNLLPGSTFLPAGGTITERFVFAVSSSQTPAIYPINFFAQNESSQLQHYAILYAVVVSQNPPAGEPPTAVFTFTPSTPEAGQRVFFDGTASSDPNGFITHWIWNFGDGYFSNDFLGSRQTANETYLSPGVYNASLVIVDNGGRFTIVTHHITVAPGHVHDVGITSIEIKPPEVVRGGQAITVNLALENLGQYPESANVKVFYGLKVAFQQNVTIAANTPRFSMQAIWNTTGVTPGTYTIWAAIFLLLAIDQNPGNDQLIGGQITIHSPRPSP